jgi:hypothetical protein
VLQKATWNKNVQLGFSLQNDPNWQGVLTNIDTLSEGAKIVKDSVQEFVDFLNQFASAGSNLFTGFIAIELQNLKDALNTIITTGGAFIVIHPYNRSNPRYIKYWDPITVKLPETEITYPNSFGSTITNNTVTNTNTNSLFSITSTNTTTVNQQLTTFTGGNTTTTYVNTLVTSSEVTVPIQLAVMTPREALYELIQSFDNTSDTTRPTWGNKTYSAGIGFIGFGSVPSEFLSIISTINSLFNNPELTQIQTDFDNIIKTLDADTKSLGGTITQGFDTVSSKFNWKGFTPDFPNPIDAVLIKAKWVNIDLKAFPIFRELITIVDDFLDGIAKMILDSTQGAVSLFTDALSLILKWVLIISDIISRLHDFVSGIITTLESGQLYTFIINPPDWTGNDTPELYPGGVQHIKNSIINSIEDPTATGDQALFIAELDKNNFSAVMFMGYGFPNLDIQYWIDLFTKPFTNLYDAYNDLFSSFNKSFTIAVSVDTNKTYKVGEELNLSVSSPDAVGTHYWTYSLKRLTDDKIVAKFTNENPFVRPDGEKTNILKVGSSVENIKLDEASQYVLTGKAFKPLPYQQVPFGTEKSPLKISFFVKDGTIIQGGVMIPSAPKNLSVIGGDTKAVLTWVNADRASSHTVYVSTNATFLVETATPYPNSISPLTISGLTNGTKYYFTIKAENEAGKGPASNTVNSIPRGYPATGALLFPLNLKSTSISENQVTLSWDAVSGATTYTIYASTNSSTQIFSGLTSLTYTHTSLIAGTVYSYYIVSVASGVESVPSPSISVETTQTVSSNSAPSPDASTQALLDTLKKNPQVGEMVDIYSGSTLVATINPNSPTASLPTLSGTEYIITIKVPNKDPYTVTYTNFSAYRVFSVDTSSIPPNIRFQSFPALIYLNLGPGSVRYRVKGTTRWTVLTLPNHLTVESDKTYEYQFYLDNDWGDIKEFSILTTTGAEQTVC